MTTPSQPESTRVTVTALRKKYPRPLRADHASGYVESEYCVGGAICIEMGIDRHGCNFPTAGEVERAVMKANSSIDRNLLTDKDYEHFISEAEKVINLNDIGHFDAAWKVLGALLRWKPKLMTIEEICSRESAMSQPSTQSLRDCIKRWRDWLRNSAEYRYIHHQNVEGCADELESLLPSLESALGERQAHDLITEYRTAIASKDTPAATEGAEGAEADLTVTGAPGRRSLPTAPIPAAPTERLPGLAALSHEDVCQLSRFFNSHGIWTSQNTRINEAIKEEIAMAWDREHGRMK